MPEIEEAEYDVMDRYRRMSRASERYGCSIRELDKWIRSGRKPAEKVKKHPLRAPGGDNPSVSAYAEPAPLTPGSHNPGKAETLPGRGRATKRST